MSERLSKQEILIRSIRAKRRFKALVRNVIANIPWLSVIEDDELTENVKKNVQLIKRRRAKKSPLTVHEKGILCKRAANRTEEEKAYLYRIIGNLKCFRKYPENVKMQLAAVTYFSYFPAGRVVVKQDHEARAMYFILLGEVSVSVTSLDPVIKENVTTIIGNMNEESLFGEVALLHEIPRTATITTATPCEFLYLKKADFDIVLKASVEQEWKSIQNAMNGFTYFQDWDDVSIRECCIYSHIKIFDRDQTILGDGRGVSTSCYFILKGRCRIIEHLLIDITYDKHGKRYYKLNEDVADANTHVHEEKLFLDEQKGSGSIHRLSKVHVTSDPLRTSFPTLQFKKVRSLQKKSNISPKEKVKEPKSVKLKELQGDEAKRSSKTATSKLNFEDELVRLIPSEKSTSSHMTRETHFMQVCILSEKACFGLGENQNRRRVVAMSDKVECLLIPRYWLLQRNKGNIWSKIIQYLNNQIPSTRQVYNEFLMQRKWMVHRKKLFADLSKKPPTNAYYNIPYSIRINEDLLFGTM